MSALLYEPEPSPRNCFHEGLEWLGGEGTATFYRCTACGGVVILQAGHRWVLHRTATP